MWLVLLFGIVLGFVGRKFALERYPYILSHLPSMLALGRPHPGSVNLIVGPMGARKTSHLFVEMETARIARYKCILVKYSHEPRYGESKDEAVTHNGVRYPAIPCQRVADVYDQIRTYDVIGFDEGQFFEDLPKFADRLAREGKCVLIAGLNGTSEREPWPIMSQLFAIAETIHKPNAVCTRCGAPAAFTKKKVARATTTPQQDIGGFEKYDPCDRACFYD